MRGAARARGAVGTAARWLRSGSALVLCLTGLVLAQGARSVGSATAEIPLLTTVDLGPVLELRLGVATVVFDLERLNETEGAVCVLGRGADVRTGSGPDGGDAVAPAGISLRIGAWPALEALGASPLASYPPPPDQAIGGVVCYRTFTLDAYANVVAWQLDVARVDVPGGPPFPMLYVGSVCPGDVMEGLLPVADAEHRTLRRGDAEGGCSTMLVAMAVRVDDAIEGTARTELRYTLLSADADFGTE